MTQWTEFFRFGFWTFCGLLIVNGSSAMANIDHNNHHSSVVKVRISNSAPPVWGSTELLCQISNSDLKDVFDDQGFTDGGLKCRWIFYPRNATQNSSEIRRKYEIKIDEDDIQDNTTFCKRSLSDVTAKKNDGMYRCEFFRDGFNLSVSSLNVLNLTVIVPPSGQAKIMISPNSSFHRPGMLVNLTCHLDNPQSTGNPLVYRWRHLENNAFNHTGSVLSVVVSENGLDSYECIPENAAGRGTSSTIDVGMEPLPFLTFTVFPQKGQLEATVDQVAINLNCSAVGWPAFTLVWCLGDLQICTVFSQSAINQTNSDFVRKSSRTQRPLYYSGQLFPSIVTPVSRNDDALWTCIAVSNNNMRILGHRSVHFTRQRGPDFINHGTKFTPEDQQLSCSAAGRPRPKLLWTFTDKNKNSVNVTSSGIFHVIDHQPVQNSDDTASSQLVLKTLNVSDGIYSCTAVNAHGRVTFNFTSQDGAGKEVDSSATSVLDVCVPASVISNFKIATGLLGGLSCALTIGMVVFISLYLQTVFFNKNYQQRKEDLAAVAADFARLAEIYWRQKEFLVQFVSENNLTVYEPKVPTSLLTVDEEVPTKNEHDITEVKEN